MKYFVLSLLLFCPYASASSPTTKPASKPSQPIKKSSLVLSSNGMCAPVTSSVSAHVQWANWTFSQALKHAKKTGCPILLDMYATWCYPCKKYDKNVFNRVNVAQFIHRNFIPLRRDGLKGEGRTLVKRFNCVTFPCILVIRKEGLEVERITRFMKSSSFIWRLQQIRKGKSTLASLLPKLKLRPKDAILRYRIGRRLAYRGDARSIRHLMFVANHPPSGYSWLAPRALYILGRIYHRNSKRDYASAIRVFDLYLKRFPKARRARRVAGLKRWCLRRLQRRR